jgi:hypothetical protein
MGAHQGGHVHVSDSLLEQLRHNGSGAPGETVNTPRRSSLGRLTRAQLIAGH